MLEGHHFQNAYVTRNLEKAMQLFEKRADIRQKLTLELNFESMTPQGLTPLSAKVGLVWVGDMQFEIIQPNGGNDAVYRDGLPAEGDGIAFHHICYRVLDWDEFFPRAKANAPWPVLLEGEANNTKYIYFDARKELGHLVEYMYMPEEMWKAVGGL